MVSLGQRHDEALKERELLVSFGADPHRCIGLGAKKIEFISNQLEYTYYGYINLGSWTVADYLHYLGLCKNYDLYLYKIIYLKCISTPSFKQIPRLCNVYLHFQVLNVVVSASLMLGTISTLTI